MKSKQKSKKKNRRPEKKFMILYFGTPPMMSALKELAEAQGRTETVILCSVIEDGLSRFFRDWENNGESRQDIPDCIHRPTKKLSNKSWWYQMGAEPLKGPGYVDWAFPEHHTAISLHVDGPVAKTLREYCYVEGLAPEVACENFLIDILNERKQRGQIENWTPVSKTEFKILPPLLNHKTNWERSFTQNSQREKRIYEANKNILMWVETGQSDMRPPLEQLFNDQIERNVQGLIHDYLVEVFALCEQDGMNRDHVPSVVHEAIDTPEGDKTYYLDPDWRDVANPYAHGEFHFFFCEIVAKGIRDACYFMNMTPRYLIEKLLIDILDNEKENGAIDNWEHREVDDCI